MNFANFTHFAIFSPLFAAILCFFCDQFLAKKSILKKIIPTIFLSLIWLFSFFIFLKLKDQGQISNSFFAENSLFLINNFQINFFESFFLFLIISLTIFIKLFHQEEIEKKLTKKNLNLFNCSLFINLFSIFGLISTKNLFEIFIFCEIFFLSSFTIFSLSKNQIFIKNSLKYLTSNIVLSTIFLFCIFSIYFKFSTLQIQELQNILLIEKNSEFLKTLLFLLTPALFLRFFSFWRVFENLKSEDDFSNYFISYNFLINFNLGAFIFLKLGAIFSYDISISLIISLIFLILILYFSIKNLFTKHILPASLNLGIIIFSFSIISFLINPKAQITNTISFLILFNLITIFLLIFGFYLKRNFNSSNFDRISDLTAIDSKWTESIITALKFSLILLIFAPPFLLFSSSYNFIEYIYNSKTLYSLESLAFLKPIFILTVFVIQSSLLIFAYKIISKIFYPENISDFEFEEPEAKKYLTYLSIFFIIIFLYSVLSLKFEFTDSIINKISQPITTNLK